MKQRTCTIVLAAAVIAASVFPAFADDTVCTVKAPAIRLRQSPSKKGKVVSMLKKDTRVKAEAKCSGGWVKVVTEDGRFTGYVGGWALTDASPIAAASGAPANGEAAKVAANPAPVKVEVAKSEETVAGKKAPSTEELAIQITNLRLDVLTLRRDMDGVKKDMKKVKVAMGRGHKRHLAANVKKKAKG